MKTLRFKSAPALFLIFSLAIAMLLGMSPAAAAVIVNVVETGGDNEATDTIAAKWTGQTFPISVANEPVRGATVGGSYTVGVFTNYAPLFVDRAHAYTNASAAIPLPSYLVGAEYIMSGNDNRDNAGYRLDVTVSAPVAVYMLIDNRLGDPNSGNADPPSFGPTKMQWILDEGWQPTTNGMNRTGNVAVPDEVGLDETGGTPPAPDGTINQWYSVYVKTFPAGTFQLKQADNAGQNMYGVVIAALPPMTPVARLISPATNTASFQAATNNLLLGVLSATPMDTNSIQVLLNGSNITSSVIISGDDTNATITYTGLTSNTIYSGTITVTNNIGPTTFNFSFDTFVPGSMLVIETEDYNYGDGDCSVPGSPLPPTQGGFYYDNPAPGTYNGLMGFPEIDYHDNSTNVNSSGTNAYRLCDPVGTRISGDVVRPPFDISGLPDYELWQIQAGEWLNYTRTIAAGTYTVYLRTASTGPATIRLDKVSGDVTLTTNQPTSAAGTFIIPNTAGAYRYVPMTDALGSNAVVTFTSGGPETVRLSAISANNNLRPTFFIFVPTTAALPPAVTSVSPAFNATDVPLDAVILASIVNGSTAVDVSSIVLKFNGVDVSSAIAVTNTPEGVTVYYDPSGLLATNATYSVYLQFSDNGVPARSFTNRWTFNTISGAPFITKAQQGTTGHWSQPIWSNPPNTTVSAPVAGQKYVAVAGGNPTRIRNPASGSGDSVLGVKTFPGDSLQLNSGTEIRAKGPGNTLDFPGVSGGPGLIFNGGNIDAGDDAVFPITGVILVQSPSTITSGDAAQSARGWQIGAEIRGDASLQITKQVTSPVPAVEVISSNNPFSGDWIVLSGLLKGTGSNSLGTGDIIIAATNSALVLAQVEIMYNIDSSGVLTLTNGGQIILHQDARFGGLIIEGTSVANGLHSYAELAAAYPNNFAAGGSGSIFVNGPGGPTITLTNVGLSGTNFTFQFNTSAGTGYTVEYKNEIDGPSWSPLQTVTGTGGMVTVTNSITEATNRFFRVRSP